MRRWPWLVLLAPALLGADDSCHADKSLGGNDPASEGVACGSAICDAGNVCCDDSCGACAPTNDQCASVECGAPACGSTTCGEGTLCCNDLCCLPAGQTCTAESCQGGTGGALTCGESTCDGATETCCVADGCTICIPQGQICNGQQCN